MMPRPELPLALIAVLALAACATPVYRTPGSPGAGPVTPATAESAGSAGSAEGQPEAPVVPAPIPPTPAPKSYRLSAATNSLVTQAQGATARGDFDAAAATLERALRIEPDNPLVWIEMGRARLASGDAAQAENMGRRALALAAGAPREQASARQLIADAQSAR